VEKRGSLGGDEVRDLIELLAEPSPAMYVRMVLRLYRDRDWPFERAWAQALRSLPRKGVEDMDEWRAQLHRDKELWRMAYGYSSVEEYDEGESERRQERSSRWKAEQRLRRASSESALSPAPG
jgi:hypothetical protein